MPPPGIIAPSTAPITPLSTRLSPKDLLTRRPHARTRWKGTRCTALNAERLFPIPVSFAPPAARPCRRRKQANRPRAALRPQTRRAPNSRRAPALPRPRQRPAQLQTTRRPRPILTPLHRLRSRRQKRTTTSWSSALSQALRSCPSSAHLSSFLADPFSVPQSSRQQTA